MPTRSTYDEKSSLVNVLRHFGEKENYSGKSLHIPLSKKDLDNALLTTEGVGVPILQMGSIRKCKLRLWTPLTNKPNMVEICLIFIKFSQNLSTWYRI